jgi:hypothetical protein
LQLTTLSETDFPQPAQNNAPSINGVLQFMQVEPLSDKPVPQLTHFFAFLSLSDPHFKHAVYGSSQYGQNFKLLENFFAQLEQ